jgi:hypothetical protein
MSPNVRRAPNSWNKSERRNEGCGIICNNPHEKVEKQKNTSKVMYNYIGIT